MSDSVTAYYDELSRQERQWFKEGRKSAFKEISAITADVTLNLTESFINIADLVYKELHR